MKSESFLNFRAINRTISTEDYYFTFETDMTCSRLQALETKGKNIKYTTIAMDRKHAILGKQERICVSKRRQLVDVYGSNLGPRSKRYKRMTLSKPWSTPLCRNHWPF
jgi:hypothetical protein